MANLSERDASLVLAAADELIKIDGDADFASSVLAVINSVIPCDIATYNEVDLATGRSNVAVFPHHRIPEMVTLMPVFERVVHDHPIAVHISATGCTTALRLEDVISDDELFENSFYVDFFHGMMGLRHQLAIALPSPSWLVFGVALSRKSGDRFTDRDVTLLNALRPHIVHNYRRAEFARSRESFEQTAVEEGWAVVLLDNSGTVLRIDGDAGPAYEIGQLVPDDVRRLLSQPHQESLIRTGSTSPNPDSGGTSVRVHAADSSNFLLLVRRGGKDLKSSLTSRGFTSRQADVAEQLLIGGTNDQLARRLTISTGTVRKHLEALYRGLDVQDRSSAIAQLAKHAKAVDAV